MRAVRHGRWSLLLAASLVAAACGTEEPVEVPAAKEASIGGDQPVSAAGICSPWDCTSDCCTEIDVWVGTITVCEPACKLACESHNFACNPGVCAAIRAADASYDTLKSQWQLAQRNGAFCGQMECDLLADMGEEGVSKICQFAAGPYCSIGNAIANEENHCFCAELDYSSCTSSGGGGTVPPPSCSGTCCDWDENGVCTSCVKRPAVCP